MALNIYRPPPEEPDRNPSAEVLTSAQMPAFSREEANDLAHQISTLTARSFLGEVHDARNLKEQLITLGHALEHLPDDMSAYVRMLGEKAEGVEFDARHVQLIRAHVVNGIFSYLNDPDLEIQSLALRAITSSTLQIPGLLPVIMDNLEFPQLKAPGGRGLVVQSLNFLATQDLSALDSSRLEIVVGHLASGESVQIRLAACKVLGKIGEAAAKYLPDLISLHSDFVDGATETSNAPSVRRLYRRMAAEVGPEVLKILPGQFGADSYLLEGEDNPLRKLGVQLTGREQSWVAELVRANAIGN